MLVTAFQVICQLEICATFNRDIMMDIAGIHRRALLGDEELQRSCFGRCKYMGRIIVCIGSRYTITNIQRFLFPRGRAGPTMTSVRSGYKIKVVSREFIATPHSIVFT